MLGSLTIYLKGMRRMMFQLSGFYCRASIVGISIMVLVSIPQNGTQDPLRPQRTLIIISLTRRLNPKIQEPW